MIFALYLNFLCPCVEFYTLSSLYLYLCLQAYSAMQFTTITILSLFSSKILGYSSPEQQIVLQGASQEGCAMLLSCPDPSNTTDELALLKTCIVAGLTTTTWSGCSYLSKDENIWKCKHYAIVVGSVSVGIWSAASWYESIFGKSTIIKEGTEQ